MKRTKGLFKIYLSIAVVGAGLVVFAYAAAQQALRLGANDLPRQLAEDTAAKLNAGAKPSDVVSTDKVDVQSSLAPFVIVVDKDVNVLASSGTMGELPLPPKSSFNNPKTNKGENVFTWQPKPGVRQATVIVPYAGGYVVAAHSLRSVEKNVDKLNQIAILTVLGVVAAPAIVLVMLP